MENIQNNIRKYWGKARPGFGSGPIWHPLAYHSLDVAAVGEALLEARPGIRSALARMASLDEATAQAWLLIALAWHDLGKFGDGFQAKAPPALEAIGRAVPETKDEGHANLTMHLWADEVASLSNENAWFGPSRAGVAPRQAFHWFLEAAAGHHGRPATPLKSQLRSLLQGEALSDSVAFAEAAARLFAPPAATGAFAETACRRASWFVAGLSVLCDWIGSNTRWFEYREPEQDFQTYWRETARPSAYKAIREAGLVAAAPRRGHATADLLPAGQGLSPLQDFAATAEVSAGPQIFVLEDLTGAGKTEAALILARRMMAAGAADGVYFALPTMATANAMYARLEKLLPLLFAEGASPTLALLHGKTRLRQALQRAQTSAPDIGYGDERSATQLMTAWLSDDRRKGFWADIGAGTIDQALLSVLPAKFQSLRLAGLARKILIVDEAHAYDAFTFGELSALLRFHAAMGGSAIVLSATLPASLRRELIQSFKGSLTPDATALEGEMSAAYPLASAWRPDAPFEQAEIQAAERSVRCVRVERIASTADALDLALADAKAGKRVCRLVNTVDDAIEAYTALREAAGPDLPVDLFHARFAFCDRQAKEEACLARFGKIRRPEDAPGRILVATQVVEQSLDLDFDVLITDLAPIDALIQRAGRLWRHSRDGRTGAPVLHVVMPPPAVDARANWYSAMFRRAAYVYPDHAKLWRTAWLLADTPELTFPGDARRLVEGVYGDDFPVAIPDAFSKSALDAEGKAFADQSQGTSATLNLSDGFTHGGIWEDEADILTRLGEQQTVFRLARWENGALRPWADHQDPFLAWQLSEIAVQTRRVKDLPEPAGALAIAVAAARATWPDAQYGPQVLALVPGGDGGFKLAMEGWEQTLSYDAAIGFRIEHWP